MRPKPNSKVRRVLQHSLVKPAVAALMCMSLLLQPVAGATLYWDTDASTALNDVNGTALGGSGNWDLVSSNWWDLSSLTAWPNTSADIGIFSGPVVLGPPTANTVTLSSGITANQLSFVRSGYTLTGGDLTLAGTTPTLQANLAESATINSQILGTAGLTKKGGGSIRLANATNGYTGTTTIANGSLIISNAAALGGTGTVSILTSNNTPLNTALIGFGGGSLVLDGTATGFTFARDVDFEGRGPIGDRGSAILSLGNNTLSGTLRSAISPLPLSPTATIRNSRINSINGLLTLSGTLDVGGTAGTTVTNLGGVNSAGVGDYLLTGVLTGTGTLEKSGAGTLFLNASNTSGFSGRLRVSSSATGQQSSVRVTSLNDGANTTSIFGTANGTTTSAPIDMNGGVLEILSDSSLNFGKNVYQRATSTIYVGPAAGGSGINGTATFGSMAFEDNLTNTFNSRNGYGVSFTTAPVVGTTAGDNPSTITNNMGGTLSFTGNFWSNANNTDNRTMTIQGNGNTVINGNVVASAAAFNHNLSKTGSGLLTVTGNASTLDGTVSIQGSMAITDFRSIGAATNAETITLGNATTTAGNLIIGTSTAPTAANLTTSRPIVLNGTTAANSIIANQSGTTPVTLNGAFTKPVAGNQNLTLGGTNATDNIITTALPTMGTGGLIKVGSGTWVLSGSNLYTGPTTISNGTLKLNANAAASTIIADASAITFNANAATSTAGGTLRFTGVSGSATTEVLGALTPTAGPGVVTLVSGGGGAAANLTFSSLGATAAASSVNFITSAAGGGLVTLTGQAATTATNLPGTANFQGHLYINGADFATINGSAQVVAPTYASTGDFQNALSALAATVHNKLTGSFTNAAATVSSLVTNSQTLTMSGNLVVSTGGILQSGGMATIQSDSATSREVRGGAAGVNVAFRVNGLSDTLNIGSATNPAHVGSFTTAGLTKNGAGTLVFYGTNAQTGTTNINEGTVRLSGAASRLSATSANLVIRQGAVLQLDGTTGANATVAALDGAGAITNVNATAATFTQTGSGTWNGIFQDGAGVLNVTKGGTTGAPTWIGLNTYTGVTTIGGTTGSVTVNTLADGGVASGIGASSNAASNLIFAGSTAGLIYQGNILDGALTLGSRSASTDRLFTLAAAATGATLSSTVTNNNAIVWSNTGAIVNNTTANATLTLTGTSTGDNTLNPQLADSSAGGGVTLSVTKAGAGQWNLGSTNNTYTGITTLNEGILGLNSNGALPSNSPLLLAPSSATSVAVFQMSGTFDRNLAATATAGSGTVTFGGTTASTTGGVGFAAHATPLTVAIGGVGSPTALTWGSGGFVGTGAVQNLVLNSTTALSAVDFRNAIDLGALARTINVLDNGNTGADYATMSGVLSGSGGGIVKIGSGILRLTGANTYTGVTQVQAGTLVVQSLGSSTGGGSSSVGAGGVTMDNTNAIQLGAGGNNAGLLQYVGPGETSDRKIRFNSTTGTSSTNQIHADGSGPLILTNVANDMTAGAKTVVLRGTNTAGNMITSVLADNGGALSVTVDGGATWILTGANTFTGNLTSGAGALGIGDAAAVGAGTLVNSNGNIFAYGADRTVTNALTLSNNTTNGWLGDYSLTFSNVVNMGASANNVTTNNNIVAGKTLTFNNGVTANALTANRAWIIDGAGETVINGDFTTSTAFGVRFDVNGGGTLTLGTNGATSNFNQGITAVDVDRGTLKFTVNNAIPTLAATNGGITLSPEVATGDTATLNLNGTSQTINALTATSDGSVIIDNTSGTAASLTFGANDTAVSFGNGTGTYTITDSGAGALSIFKAGNTSTTIPAGVTLTYQGTTGVTGGSMTIASPVNGTSGLSVTNSGSTLTLSGGITNANAVTSILVENGGTLNLTDAAGSQFANLATLTLGSTGGTMTTLGLNVGDLSTPGDELNTDLLSLLASGTLNLFAGNKVTLNLTDAGLNPGETYDLLTFSPGGFTSGPLAAGDWLLGATPGGFSSISLTVNNDRIFITTGTLITGSSYWNGTSNTTWNVGASNWSQDKAGTIAALSIPGQGTDVIFQSDAATSGAVVTTLEQNFKINSLTFEAATVPANTPTSIAINPGTVATNRLEIAPQLPADGIEIATGGTPLVTISAPLKLGANQTWNIADAASTLTLSGGLQGEKDVTKAGSGKVILAAAADSTFNTGLTSDFTINGGNLEITNNGALGTTANSNLANVVINSTGAFYYNNATAGTVANPITLVGGTLSAGGNAHTYSGNVNISANSFINMADSNGPAANTARNITLSGVVSGSGSLTIDSNNTASNGNQIGGNLTISNAGSTWNGALVFNRGTVTIASTASPTVTPASITFNSFGKLGLNGVDGQTINLAGALTLAAGAVGELNFDNATGTPVTDYVVNQNGPVTLGSSGTGGTLRVFLTETQSRFNLVGAVTLGGNSSISVANNAARILMIDSIISDGGSGYALAINDDAGAWAQTNGTVRLTAANTFSGNFTLGEGIAEFSTVTDIGGAASNLGQGSAISLGGGNLRFIGSVSQSTNRPITATVASTLSAHGTGGATITYTGAVSTAGTTLTLSGTDNTAAGFITGGITQTGAAADISVNSGNWTLSGSPSVLADDIIVTNASAVLNLNGASLISYTTGTSNGLYSRTGATINILSNNIFGPANSGGLDFILLSDNSVGLSTLNTNTFTIETPRLDLGNRNIGYEAQINGTGTVLVTGGDINLFRGTVNASLSSTGSTAFEKFGPGTVTLYGDNSGLASTGASIVYEGSLDLDYTVSNTTKLRAASALDMRGSTLTLTGNASAATSQSVGSFTLGSGGTSTINMNPGAGQEIVLNLNAITRAGNAQDGTIRFNLPTGTQSATNGITTDSLNTVGTGTNAILGGWATVNDGTGVFFARNVTNAADGNIGAAVTTSQDTVASWLTGENISDATSFTGTLGKEFTLNSLRFNAAAGSDLLLGTAGHLRLTSGGILVTSNVAGSPSITGGTLDSNAFALPVAASDLIVIQDSASTFEIGSSLHRSQNLVKSGSGTLLLSGTNTYTGYTEINEGVLQVSGGDAIGDISIVTLAAGRNSTFQLLSNETIGRLQGGQRQADSDYGMVDVGSNTLTINQSANTTYSGRFTGSGTIILNAGNTGNLNYAGQTSTGLFTGSVIVNGGLFQLSGATARLGNATSFTINGGGNFLLDNNDDTNVTDRLSDTVIFTLNSAAGPFSGETRPRGFANRNNDDDNATETYGSLILNSGASYVSLEASGGTSAQAGLTAAIGWTRNSGATINVRGRNLGATADASGRAQFKVANANDAAMIAANVGGGGVIGGTAKNVSIIPWAIGEGLTAALADGNMGNTFLSYVDDRGFVPLNLTNEFATFGTAASGDNVRESLTADLTGIAGATVNSLILHNNNTAASTINISGSGASQTLAVTSGAMLFTLNTAATASSAHSLILGGFDSGITVGGTNEYVIHVVNPSSAANTATLTATISSPLTSTADITKSGRGTLILNQANTAGGGANKTTINEGVLEIADLDNIGGGTGGLAFAGGTLRLASGFSDDFSSRTVTFLVGGATLDMNGNSLVLANSIGGGGTGGFTKTGTGNLTLSAAASYSGVTQFTNGTLTLGVNNALPSGTSLALGSGATNAILDTNGFNQTLGSLVNTTNSTTLTTQVVIDTGNTLTVNGPVLIGADAAASTTLFSATGGGTFVQNQTGGIFQLGGGTGATNTNVATADFSGLAGFTVNLGPTGVFRIGDNNTNGSGSPSTNSTLTMAGTSNTITAGILGIGDSMGQGGTGTLELGGGTNVINVDTVYIGAASPSARGSGALVFDGVGGSLTLRGSSGGTSRSDVAMTTSSIGSGFVQTNTFLTAGHTVDLKIDTFLMSERTASTGSVISTFDFDTGTLDVTNLIMSRRSGAGTGDSTSNVTIGGGTAILGTIDMAASTGTGSGSDAIATLNITGGTVTIGTGSGTAINMANAGTGRTVTSNIGLTGGTLTVTGNIIRTGGAGTENETLTLNGSSLNMSGNSIGTSGASIVFAAQSGTLENLAEFNGGGVLTKTTAGTLIMQGSNTYTGGTAINGGVVQVNSAGALGSTGNVSFGGGTLQFTANNTADYSSRILGSGSAISIDTNGRSVTFATTLASSNTGGLTLNDTNGTPGTLTLAAATGNSFTGNTTVTVGTLLANNTTGSATGSGTVTVNGGILGGSGTIAGNTTINATGVLAAGGAASTAGTLTLQGDLVMAGSGSAETRLSFDFTNATGNAGGEVALLGNWWSSYNGTLLSGNGSQANDLVSLTATTPTITWDTGGKVSLNQLGSAYTWILGDILNLMDWNNVSNTNPITGTFGTTPADFDLPSLGSGLTWDTTRFMSTGAIAVTPEPGRALLLMFGLVALLFRRRRRE